jgi:hypothetical protein
MGEVSNAHVQRTSIAMAVTLTKLGYPVDLNKITGMLASAG